MTNTPDFPERTPLPAEAEPGEHLADAVAESARRAGAGAAEPAAQPDVVVAGSAPERDVVVAGPAPQPGAGVAESARQSDVVAAESAPERDAPILDEDTYSRILEPRGAGRLPLGDGTWHQLARAYVRVQVISQGAFLLLVLAAALALQFFLNLQWQWIPAGVLAVITLVGLVITPRQARSFGYQLRHDDLVFRRGILWQRVVAVPYGRMQLVDITHGPLDRGFGIAQLKLVTAAASTGVTIPGLTQAAAEQLRDTLIAVAETRRTGL